MSVRFAKLTGNEGLPIVDDYSPLTPLLHAATRTACASADRVLPSGFSVANVRLERYRANRPPVARFAQRHPSARKAARIALPASVPSRSSYSDCCKRASPCFAPDRSDADRLDSEVLPQKETILLMRRRPPATALQRLITATVYFTRWSGLPQRDTSHQGYQSAAPTGCFFLLLAVADLPSLPEDFPSLPVTAPSAFSAAAAFLYAWLR